MRVDLHCYEEAAGLPEYQNATEMLEKFRDFKGMLYAQLIIGLWIASGIFLLTLLRHCTTFAWDSRHSNVASQ